MNGYTVSALPSSMPAWVLHGPKDMRLEERPLPRLAAGEVLVEIGSVGVCGSDKHFYFEGRASSEIVEDPVVLGHEFGGRVVAVADVDAAGRLGQRVSVEPLVPDPGTAETRSGRYNIDPNQRFFGVPGTDGALQGYLAVPGGNAHAIPDAVSDDAAAMVETISVALNGLRKADVHMGHRVLVTGGGPVGLFALQLARLHGADEVVVVEPQTARRRIASSLGGSAVADLGAAGAGFDSLIECSGVDAARYDGCLAVRPGGRAVFVGVGAQSAAVPMPAVIEREVSIHGVMRYSFTWPTVIRALARGAIDADGLVSRVLTLPDALTAWTAPQPDEIKTMIRVRDRVPVAGGRAD